LIMSFFPTGATHYFISCTLCSWMCRDFATVSTLWLLFVISIFMASFLMLDFLFLVAAFLHNSIHWACLFVVTVSPRNQFSCFFTSVCLTISMTLSSMRSLCSLIVSDRRMSANQKTSLSLISCPQCSGNPQPSGPQPCVQMYAWYENVVGVPYG
jgi:hypothetical protein